LWSVPNIVSSKSQTVQYRVPGCPGQYRNVQYRVPRCPSQYRNVHVPSCPGTDMSRILAVAIICRHQITVGFFENLFYFRTFSFCIILFCFIALCFEITLWFEMNWWSQIISLCIMVASMSTLFTDNTCIYK
jgi:hypothetical protein